MTDKKNKAGTPQDERKLWLETLRSKAEIVFSKEFHIREEESKQMQEVFHELQIYQLELEIQNEELLLLTEHLEKQKVRFANLFELAPAGYLTLNAHGVITEINAAAAHLLGASKHMLLNKPLAGSVHTEELKLFYSFFHRVIRTQAAQSCMLRFKHLAGTIFHAQVSGIGIINPSEAPIYYLSIIDVTQKKIAEMELEAAKRRLEMALGASHTGIWEIKLPQHDIWVDAFASQLLGLDDVQTLVSYEAFMRTVQAADRERLDSRIKRSIFKQSNIHEEFRLANKEVVILAKGQVQEDAFGEKRFLGTLTDVTLAKRMEQETIVLREQHRQLTLAAALQAEENERKRVSEVLHDSVGQMLYAIKMNLEQCADTKEQHAFRKANQFLEKTIQDLRNISFELAPAILAEFGLQVTLEEMANRIASEHFQMSIDVDLKQEPPLPLAQSIFRILQELVNNAIRHARASKIAIELFAQENELHIQVTDNGVGFQHDANAPIHYGTGLSSIRNRLHLYDGKIGIHSEPHRGTKVCITMPYSPSQ